MSHVLDMNVTIEHVARAVDTLRGAIEPELANHEFDQTLWGATLVENSKCTTAGCTWGTAFLLANGRTTSNGPSREWEDQDSLHFNLYAEIFCNMNLTNDEIIERFDKLIDHYGWEE